MRIYHSMYRSGAIHCEAFIIARDRNQAVGFLEEWRLERDLPRTDVGEPEEIGVAEFGQVARVVMERERSQ